MQKSTIHNLLMKGNLKIVMFSIIFIFLPTIVFADTAGPVLTKNQACQQKDGQSMNRLQIFLNEKKSDTLYFYKKDNILYYLVPMFPYAYKEYNTSFGYVEGSYSYYASLFLYQYSCDTYKPLRISENLKK